jgi:hypothetical protein
LNQQKQLLATSTLRTTSPTKSSKKNVHTDLTAVEDALVAADTVEVAAEVTVVEVAEAAMAAEAAATAVAAVATVEAVEEDMVAAEAADATNIRHK